MTCFGCSRTRSPSISPRQRTPTPRQRTPTQAEIRAAVAIQRVYRGGSARTALRSGKMKSQVYSQRRAAFSELSALPVTMRREVLKRAFPRVPRSFNKRYAPKVTLSPTMQQWLRTTHRNAFNFPNSASYNQYINRINNYGNSATRENKIKAILARYELLQPSQGAAVAASPRVSAWRRRLETNFKRKYVPRRQNRLSSRELYSFLKTASMPYLTRAANNAPRYA